MTRAWISGGQVVCCRTDSWTNSCVTSSFTLVGRGLFVLAATRNIPVAELRDVKQWLLKANGVHTHVGLVFPRVQRVRYASADNRNPRINIYRVRSRERLDNVLRNRRLHIQPSRLARGPTGRVGCNCLRSGNYIRHIQRRGQKWLVTYVRMGTRKPDLLHILIFCFPCRSSLQFIANLRNKVHERRVG